MRHLPFLLIPALLLSSCQTSTIITALDAAVAAAEIAIPLLGPAVGLPPQTSALISAYLQVVLTGTSQASTILAGPGTSEEKAAQILQLFAKISQGIVLPAGTPGTVQAVVGGIMEAVAVFLSNIQGSSSVTASVVKIPALSKSKLMAIKARSDADLVRVRAIRR